MGNVEVANYCLSNLVHRVLSYSSSGGPGDEVVRQEHASMSEKCQRSNAQSNLKNPLLVERGL